MGPANDPKIYQLKSNHACNWLHPQTWPCCDPFSNAHLSLANLKDHDTAMTTATTTNFYLQHSQNKGIHGKSPLDNPGYGHLEGDDAVSDTNEFMAAGRRDPEVYERTLQSWRAAIRRPVVRMVEKESHIIAAMQVLSISMASTRSVHANRLSASFRMYRID